MHRIGQWTRLKDGCESEYDSWHREVWSEVLAAIGKAGIANYSIFRLGRDLFAYFEVEDLAAADAFLDANPICRRWEEMMVTVIEGGDEIPFWINMTEIFHLD
jgi:L-rhamnose mutarotase